MSEADSNITGHVSTTAYPANQTSASIEML
jgi:hypothetical protein